MAQHPKASYNEISTQVRAHWNNSITDINTQHESIVVNLVQEFSKID
jgi:hypothetical protein